MKPHNISGGIVSPLNISLLREDDGIDSVLSIAQQEVQDFSLEAFDKCGLGRKLTRYYLVGNYPPILAMRRTCHETYYDNNFEDSLHDNPVDVYIHFPFCTAQGSRECTFCHFYKEKHSLLGENEYLDYCKREIAFYANEAGYLRARSLYFGGGTFSLISNSNLLSLTKFLKRKVVLTDDAEIKFEIHADAWKRGNELTEKLSILKDYGVTQIVIDIQSLNPDSLADVTNGRVLPCDFFRTLDECVRVGFNQIVTGLILGLPYESPDSFLQGLEQLTELPEIVTINTFPLMFRKGDRVWDQLSEEPNIFADVNTRDTMNHAARLFIEGRSEFYEGPIYFFNRSGTYPKQQKDKFKNHTLLGIGPSSFGFFRSKNKGLQYFNVPSVYEYIERVGKYGNSLWQGAILDNEELARRELIFGLNLIEPTCVSEIDRSYESELSKQLCSTIEYLKTNNFLEAEGDYVSLNKKGLLRAEEITASFCSDRISEELKGRSEDSLYMRYNYFPRI